MKKKITLSIGDYDAFCGLAEDMAQNGESISYIVETALYKYAATDCDAVQYALRNLYGGRASCSDTLVFMLSALPTYPANLVAENRAFLHLFAVTVGGQLLESREYGESYDPRYLLQNLDTLRDVAAKSDSPEVLGAAKALTVAIERIEQHGIKSIAAGEIVNAIRSAWADVYNCNAAYVTLMEIAKLTAMPETTRSRALIRRAAVDAARGWGCSEL